MIRDVELRAGDAAREVTYWCVHGHPTPREWSAAVAVPELWECRCCGRPAGRDARPSDLAATHLFRTPLARLRERRSEAECEALLAEALAGLHLHRRLGAVPADLLGSEIEE